MCYDHHIDPIKTIISGSVLSVNILKGRAFFWYVGVKRIEVCGGEIGESFIIVVVLFHLFLC